MRTLAATWRARLEPQWRVWLLLIAGLLAVAFALSTVLWSVVYADADARREVHLRVCMLGDPPGPVCPDS